MIYQFKRGSYLKGNAQAAGELFEQLAEQGNLTAQAVVDESRPEDAVLHNYFEWDDETAAEAYRLTQARHLINSVEIVSDNREPVRAFFNIVRADPNYNHIDTILQSEDDTHRLLETAKRELRAFQKKYAQLEELAALMEQIKEVVA